MVPGVELSTLIPLGVEIWAIPENRCTPPIEGCGKTVYANYPSIG